MEEKKPIIVMRDVSKIYHVGGEEVRALDGASLTVYEGEFVAIIGPSGKALLKSLREPGTGSS